MLVKEDHQNIDKNDYSKDTTEMGNVRGTDKLTKWSLVMIISIIYLASERAIEYSFGRQGMPVLVDLSKYACLPVSLLMFISIFTMVSWFRRRPDNLYRREKTIHLLLTLMGALIFLLVFLLPPAGLTGFRTRVKRLADVPSIRQWASSLDMPDNGYYWIKGKDLEQHTPIFKILKPKAVWVIEYVDDERDKSLYRVVNVSWRGTIEDWRLSIGPPEIGEGRIPRCDNVLQVEPGVYVYLVFK